MVGVERDRRIARSLIRPGTFWDIGKCARSASSRLKSRIMPASFSTLRPAEARPRSGSARKTCPPSRRDRDGVANPGVRRSQPPSRTRGAPLAPTGARRAGVALTPPCRYSHRRAAQVPHALSSSATSVWIVVERRFTDRRGCGARLRRPESRQHHGHRVQRRRRFWLHGAADEITEVPELSVMSLVASTLPRRCIATIVGDEA